MQFTIISAMIPATLYIEAGSQVKIMWSIATDSLLRTGSMSNKPFGKLLRFTGICNHEITLPILIDKIYLCDIALSPT